MYQAEIHSGKQQQKIFDCLKGSQKLLQRFKQNILKSMKKLFLSLAFMLIGSFAFANNSSDFKSYEMKEVEDNCFYTITTIVTYPDGSSYSYDTNYSTTATSLSNCIDKAKKHVAYLNAIV